MKVSILRGNEVFISETVLNSILVAIVLIVIGIIAKRETTKARIDKAPSNFLNIIEILVNFMEDMLKSNMGAKNMKFAPLMVTLISYLAVANTMTIAGFTSPTSDYSIALTLALFVFITVQVEKFKSSGGLIGYFKSFGKPFALITPINIISELANPISMSFRLFGNMMSGGLIMALIHNSLGYLSPFVKAPLHLYFDLFTGLLQAYIFVLLTMIFVEGATE